MRDPTDFVLLTNAPQPLGSPVFVLVELGDSSYAVQRDGVVVWGPSKQLARCVNAYRKLFPAPSASIGSISGGGE
jgi:hypothetical protein